MSTEPAIDVATAPGATLGERFGRYEILHKLASGGMGEVYLARSVGAAGFQKHVVIKKLLPHLVEQPQFVEGLIREAKLLVRLDHPNIVQVLDLGMEGSDYFMAMEYVHGYNLATIIHYCAQQHVMIPGPACAVIATQVLAGLEYAHLLTGHDGVTQNVIHRDVSPQNVLISTEGRIKLTDFGIAKVVNEAEGEFTQSLKGKFRYMAPEVVEGGRIDHRYDLFAVGILLFESLCRRHLFSGSNDINILNQVRKAHVPPIGRYHPNVLRELVTVTEKGLAKDPAARYQSAAAFAVAIREAIKPTTEAEALAEVRTFVTDVFGRPDFPINKPKLPDLNAPFSSITRSIVLHSRITELGLGRRSKGPLVALALGLLLVSGVVAYLGYMLFFKSPDPKPGDVKVIVQTRDVGVVTPPRSALDAAPAVAAPPDATPKIAVPKKKPLAPAQPFTQEVGAVAFGKQGPALKKCFQLHGKQGEAQIKLRVVSAIDHHGKVTAATLDSPDQAGTPLGRCVVGVASRVRYPRHDKPTINFIVPVTLRREE